MRRWIAGLHWGQLAMVVIFVGFVGMAPKVEGDVYAKSADEEFQTATTFRVGIPSIGVPANPTGADEFSKLGNQLLATADRWYLAAVVIWGSAIPILWIWFGARRRALPEDGDHRSGGPPS